MSASEAQNEEHEGSMKTNCSNPDCECPAQVGNKFCCDVCAGKTAEKDAICECGHPECKSGGPIS